MAEHPAPLRRPHRPLGVTKVICTANIRVALSNQLRQRAVDDDVTLSSLVEEALTRFLGPQ